MEISDLTPCEPHGDKWLKRDDVFTVGGAIGGKARACWQLLGAGAKQHKGLVTGAARRSPQIQIVSRIAKHLGIPCQCFVNKCSHPTPEMADARAQGATVSLSNFSMPDGREDKMAREYAAKHGWTYVPYGMECPETLALTAAQVANIPADVKRFVMPLGSGLAAAGVLTGCRALGRTTPVLGIKVGKPPNLLYKYAPWWAEQLTIKEANYNYGDQVPANIEGVVLDPIYEAKCYDLEPGDLLWIVGRRAVLPEKLRPPKRKLKTATPPSEPTPAKEPAPTAPAGPHRNYCRNPLHPCLWDDLPQGMEQQSLEELAATANDCYAKVRAALRTTILEAKRGGDALRAAKLKTGCGGAWGEWRTANFRGSERTAQNWMLISHDWHRIAKHVENNPDLKISKALEILTERPRNLENGRCEIDPPLAEQIRRRMTREYAAELGQWPAPFAVCLANEWKLIWGEITYPYILAVLRGEDKKTALTAVIEKALQTIRPDQIKEPILINEPGLPDDAWCDDWDEQEQEQEQEQGAGPTVPMRVVG